MQMDFKNTDYLLYGTPMQQRVFSILTAHHLLAKLAPYHPIVAGTIPLGINIDGSDVDILLQAGDLTGLKQHLTTLFSQHAGFSIRIGKKNGHAALICRFAIQGLPFELYATDVPTDRQPAYLHMVKEFEILKEKGPAFAGKIKSLKRKGIKTEPAFCLLLGIAGDPYQALLTYKTSE